MNFDGVGLTRFLADYYKVANRLPSYELLTSSVLHRSGTHQKGAGGGWMKRAGNNPTREKRRKNRPNGLLLLQCNSRNTQNYKRILILSFSLSSFHFGVVPVATFIISKREAKRKKEKGAEREREKDDSMIHVYSGSSSSSPPLYK